MSSSESQRRWPNFNPRSRMGSDCPASTRASRSAIFQSTLPHGERHLVEEPTVGHAGISIHAPAWGATPAYDRDDDESEFQSTLPHGERLQGVGDVRREVEISIHAPAWGATTSYLAGVSVSRFQSTLPHGERHLRWPIAANGHKIQSTLPHGERPCG